MTVLRAAAALVPVPAYVEVVMDWLTARAFPWPMSGKRACARGGSRDSWAPAWAIAPRLRRAAVSKDVFFISLSLFERPGFFRVSLSLIRRRGLEPSRIVTSLNE